jgi:hypothetical protein
MAESDTNSWLVESGGQAPSRALWRGRGVIHSVCVIAGVMRACCTPQCTGVLLVLCTWCC